MDLQTDQSAPLAEEDALRAAAIAARWAKLFPPYHEDDFQSSAQWGAFRAALKFNPEKGTPWKRWRDFCIRREIKRFIGRHITGQRVSCWPQDALESIEGKPLDSSFEETIAVLPEKYRDVLRLIYRDGMSATAAGKSLGYSGHHGTKLHNQALSLLKRHVA